MHTTTVRFAPSAWRDLKEHAAREGVATSQVIREAAVARVAGERATATAVDLDERVRLLEAQMGQVRRLLSRRPRG